MFNKDIEQTPTRIGFGKGLADAADENELVIGLGADITHSVNMNYFASKFPSRFYSLGIAEQNIAGVAAGLALEGFIPVMATYGVFSAMRTIDQVRISICYNNLHVIIGGAHAGISVGPDGATHQALEDIAVMRSLPNMTVLSPCDANQTYAAIQAAISDITGPVYIRFGREAVPNFTPPNFEFKVGKGQTLRAGNDACVLATGHLTWEALCAAEMLSKEGIETRVINIHTIKPIDKEIIIKAAKETGALVTAEEHQISGGLGGAVSEVVCENAPCPIAFIGVNDTFGESGFPDELMHKYGLKSTHIIEKIRVVLNNKKNK